MKLSNASLRVWDYGKCFCFYACEALAAKGVGFVDRPSDMPGWGVRAAVSYTHLGGSYGGGSRGGSGTTSSGGSYRNSGGR